MNFKAIVTLVYGLMIAGGGIAGFVAAGSLASLLSGGLLGLVIIIGAVLMFLRKPAGQYLALAATIVVAGFFGYQLSGAVSSGGAVGRAGGILILSVIELAVLLFVKSPSP